ncbi:MAG: metallophosphoesterase family protein [Rhizobiaceae bacterium]
MKDSEPHTPLIDPRAGDVEDDVSSLKDRSLIVVASTMLVEVSLSKLLISVLIMILLPAVLLGLAPLLVSAWFSVLPRETAAFLGGTGTLVLVVVAPVAAWWGGPSLYRASERSFWSLNSLVVQPGYAFVREGLRHLAERSLSPQAGPRRRAQLRGLATAGAGVVLCCLAAWIAMAAWPSTRWGGVLADLVNPQRLILPALANTAVVIAVFLAGASIVWAVADSTMDQPRDLEAYDTPEEGAQRWRVAHLSDLHAVGGAYEFRVESGRAGPRGNGRIAEVLDGLAAIHAEEPLDLVIVSGDLTDAGRSTEWAQIMDAFARHPALVERMLILPGNHDLNVVDRTNPARLEIPNSAGKRLRQMRMLSAMEEVQGRRVRVMDRERHRPGQTLSEMLAPHRDIIREFADRGSQRLSWRLADLWDDCFPMVLPPQKPGGMGVILLNSNAETHFSFTNALGLVPAMQINDLKDAVRHYPKSRWIVALHHHLVEYPTPVKKFSARIGTALINGSSFVRLLQRFGGRMVVMHGHRHVDWVGESGRVRIVSAPSPVMSPPGAACFYIHTLAMGPRNRLELARPERVVVRAEG